MAKREDQRWKGWRTKAGPAPIKGKQPIKRPGTRRRKKAKLYPWFWVRSKREVECGGCSRKVAAGIVVAFARPKKVLCRSCVEEKGLEPTTSRALKEERQRMVQQQLRRSAGEQK